MSKLSFIIVAFNSANDIKNLIDSLKKNIFNISYEIIIVDNSNCPETRKIVESYECKYIAVPANPGFSAACNIGAKSAVGNWYFFVNPDCVIESSIDFIFLNKNNSEKPMIFIPEIRESQWGNQYSARGMSFPLFTEYFKKYIGKKTGQWYRGSALLINKKCYQIVGGWSEDYFMYSEDLEFFYSAYRKNIEVVNLKLKITHFGGSSTSKIWNDVARSEKINESLLKYFIKNKLIYNGLLFYSLFVIVIGLKKLNYKIPFGWYKVLFAFKS